MQTQRVRVRRTNDQGEVLFEGIFDDLQDFDPSTWTCGELALVLDELYRQGHAVEDYGRQDIYLYELI